MSDYDHSRAKRDGARRAILQLIMGAPTGGGEGPGPPLGTAKTQYFQGFFR